MADIIKEMLKLLPQGKISESAFEGANVVLYTKDPEFFLNGRTQITELVSTFKKRIELRADPSICKDVDESREAIKKIMTEETKQCQNCSMRKP